MKKQSQLSNQIKKLQYQLSYSEHINKELSIQLATLCTRTGIAPQKYKQATGQISLINTSTHLQELYYVEPLLMCYEEVIGLLKGELEDAREQARVIQENVENVVRENGFMRKELQAKIELLAKADNLGLNVNFLTLQNKDLKDKLALLTSKIDYLTRKNTTLSLHTQTLQQKTLSLPTEHDLTQLQTRARQQLKLKQTELIDCRAQVEVLRNQLENQRKICGDLGARCEGLEAEVGRLRGEVRLVRVQMENMGTVQDKLRENLAQELATTKDQLAVSLKKQQQLFTKSMSLESQLQDTLNRTHNLSLQNSQLQSNNNNMLQMLQSYQIKVSTLGKKLKKYEAELKELGEERGQLVKRAEIAEWRLGERGEEAQRREAEWRKEKVRIGKMWEERLEAVRKGYQGVNSGGKV